MDEYTTVDVPTRQERLMLDLITELKLLRSSINVLAKKIKETD